MTLPGTDIMAKVTHIHTRKRRPLEQEWPSAREQIEEEFDDVYRDRAQLGEMRFAVARNTYVLAGFSAVAICVLTAFLWFISQQINRVLAVAPVSTQERVAAIADVMGDIPQGRRERLQSGPYRGAPTVRALQARLPNVRGITARERNAACDQVPALCAPP